jgi:hypothetical protein
MEEFDVVIISLSLIFVIFVPFSGLFWGIFIHRLIHRFEGVSLWISLSGSWVSALCLFVDDIDPLNAGIFLQVVSFR